jgi:hypothetical protein
MVKGTQRGKVAKGAHRTTSDDDPPVTPHSPPESPRTRAQRARELASSAFHKGVHDTLATTIKAVLITLAAVVVPWVGFHYFGYEIDLRGWLAGKPFITGTIKPPEPPPIPDIGTVNKLVECKVRRQRTIDRLIDRRKYAWGLYGKCKTDWKPIPDLKQTAEEACAAYLVQYRALAQDVTQREALDECVVPGAK